MAIAAVFPGQGSQSVGMLARLIDTEPAAAAAFAEADDALGFGLTALVREGPAEQLNLTKYTQPAMLAAGVAVWRAWQAHGGARPVAMAGHSVGEFTAFVCTGAIDFADALRLVCLRGELMQNAVPQGLGAVAAILGLDDQTVAQICAQVDSVEKVVEAANFNAPGQVVIAGHTAAVQAATDLAKASGARRAILLPVSVPVHCRLMRQVSTGLAQALEAITVRAPEVPVYHTMDAKPRTDVNAIKAALVAQVYLPVQWVECVRALQDAGAGTLVEIGPGRVLCGLAKRIDRALATFPVDDPDTLAAALAATEGAA